MRGKKKAMQVRRQDVRRCSRVVGPKACTGTRNNWFKLPMGFRLGLCLSLVLETSNNIIFHNAWTQSSIQY